MKGNRKYDLKNIYLNRHIISKKISAEGPYNSYKIKNNIICRKIFLDNSLIY